VAQKQFLEEMFVSIYIENQRGEEEEKKEGLVSMDSVGKKYLQLLYKHIWFNLNRPEIKDIGEKFFFSVT